MYPANAALIRTSYAARYDVASGLLEPRDRLRNGRLNSAAYWPIDSIFQASPAWAMRKSCLMAGVRWPFIVSWREARTTA